VWFLSFLPSILLSFLASLLPYFLPSLFPSFLVSFLVSFLLPFSFLSLGASEALWSNLKLPAGLAALPGFCGPHDRDFLDHCPSCLTEMAHCYSTNVKSEVTEVALGPPTAVNLLPPNLS